ncbi:VOC family protein [Adlercreutzia sp. ZJ473]|uniref:VOC family protein n=1 Tax=Adlercreutzia sp. ZJ473 TaxID=2722822 RepID=UPI00155189F6|nr:VOC family protein [Adlercreutzia sp. ZJ473]
MYETLLNKYGVRQLGYYVEDIDATAREMARLLGAGPFIDAGESTPEACTYRGKDSTLTTRVALGQFANIQVELIQVTSEGENVYSEMGRYGLHHVCIWTDDLEQTVKEFEEAGFELAMRLTSSGFEVAYFDCRDAFGHYIEVSAPQEDFYEGLAALAEEWDGENALMGIC